MLLEQNPDDNAAEHMINAIAIIRGFKCSAPSSVFCLRHLLWEVIMLIDWGALALSSLSV